MAGAILSIDPASGAGSMPGFAYFANGRLVESGVIEVPRGRKMHQRLQYIGKCLREDFQKPDVLVIEEVPPFHNKASIVLFKAMGAIIASVDCAAMLSVTPSAWHALAKTFDFEYTKSDEKDAIILGYTAMIAAGVANIDHEGILTALRDA